MQYSFSGAASLPVVRAESHARLSGDDRSASADQLLALGRLLEQPSGGGPGGFSSLWRDCRLLLRPRRRVLVMPRVIVVGGGLAGLAASAALGEAGFDVDLYEARGFLGGRATSYPLAPAREDSEVIDNCQHVLLRCCVNLLDFYRRLGVRDRVRFTGQFHFIEPGGRVSTLRRGLLPAPLHFARSFLGLRFLSLADKLAIARGLLALRRE